MTIREEHEADHDALRAINSAAFDTTAEANLVDALRAQAAPLVSLVAEEGGEIIGHILFSPVTLSDNSDLRLMGLAPMAVSPSHQRLGVGKALAHGTRVLPAIGVDAVVVLGHPTYYPLFGFRPSSRFDIDSAYEVPEEVFMIIELKHGVLEERSDRIRYHQVFADSG